MKLRLLSLSVMVLFMLASCRDRLTGPPNTTPGVSDTVALFTFQNSTKDVTGHGNDGIAYGLFQYTPDRFGNPLGAFTLDGSSNNFLHVTDQNDLNFADSDSFTLTGWVKTTATDGNIISKVGEDGWQIGLSNGFAEGWIGNSDTGVSLVAHTKVNDGQWHFIAFSVLMQGPGQGTLSLYVDSNLEATQMDGGLLWPVEPLQSEIEIGRSINATFGEIAVYSKALSLSDVQTRFHEGGWSGGTVTTPQTGWTQGNIPTTESILGMCFPIYIYNGQVYNFNPVGSTAFACGTNGAMIRSIDSGKTWQSQVSGTSQDLYRVTAEYSQNSVTQQSQIIAVAGGNNGTVIRTTDGTNWTTVSNIPFQTINGALENIRDIKFLDATHVIMVGGAGNTGTTQSDGFIMTSADAGLTWTRTQTTSITLYSIGFNPEGNVVHVVGSSGQILSSTDLGATWVNQSLNEAGDDFLAVDFSPLNNFSIGFATTAYGSIYMDYGSTFTMGGFAQSGVQSSLRTVKVTSTNEAWIAGDNGVILHTANSAVSWSRADINGVSVQWNEIVARDAHTLAFVGANGTLYWYKY